MHRHMNVKWSHGDWLLGTDVSDEPAAPIFKETTVHNLSKQHTTTEGRSRSTSVCYQSIHYIFIIN
jgi:hypothetical protein